MDSPHGKGIQYPDARTSSCEWWIVAIQRRLCASEDVIQLVPKLNRECYEYRSGYVQIHITQIRWGRGISWCIQMSHRWIRKYFSLIELNDSARKSWFGSSYKNAMTNHATFLHACLVQLCNLCSIERLSGIMSVLQEKKRKRGKFDEKTTWGAWSPTPFYLLLSSPRLKCTTKIVTWPEWWKKHTAKLSGIVVDWMK